VIRDRVQIRTWYGDPFCHRAIMFENAEHSSIRAMIPQAFAAPVAIPAGIVDFGREAFPRWIGSDEFVTQNA
jgi:hypothetical protein